jgi:hypothetical protein
VQLCHAVHNHENGVTIHQGGARHGQRRIALVHNDIRSNRQADRCRNRRIKADLDRKPTGRFIHAV